MLIAIMACILCLENDTNAKERFIDIFSDEGCELRICKIISKYLWFKPEKELCFSQFICGNCWVALSDFHIFYLRVSELHITDWKYPFTCAERKQDDDPLPQRLEEVIHNEEMPQNVENSTGNSFDAEIKLELRDLEGLSQIQIIDVSNPIDKKPRRGRPRKSQIEQYTPQAKIKIDKPVLPSNDTDSENELPLSVLLREGKFEAAIEGSLDAAIKENSAVAQSVQPDRIVQIKRRDWPRKVKNVESQPPSLLEMKKSDFEKSDNLDSLRSEIKVEKLPFHSSNDNKDNKYDLDTEDNGFQGTEDSDSSSSESVDSYEPKLEYAIIPKRKVVKPKKYRKRPKPAKTPNHMTREEIKARKAQQEEYEKVILKFFGRISCSLCELLVHNFTEIREHFRASHNIKPGYMMCCGRKFFQRKTLADHIYLHCNPEKFKCKICEEVCSDSRRLAEHEKVHADPPTKIKDRKTFQCDKCQRTYSTKAGLQDHFYLKHVPKTEFEFTCTDCNKKYPTKSLLRGHRKQVHCPKSTIICDKCGKELRTTYLKKHRELEHSEVPRPTPEPQQCQICGAWLRHMSGLRKHMKWIHEDSGSEHRCTICNKVSTNALALKRHIYMNHECERKFKCTMCEKAFKRPQDLREHTSVHTGKVLYTCPNCSMTFFSSANMYKHRQRRHRAEYEAERKKPKFLLNIMAQSRERIDEMPGDNSPSKLN